MNSRSRQFGFSTLEVLIAVSILLFAIVAGVELTFGNQSLLIDSQTNIDAVNKAQELLEQEQAYSRKDFNLVNPIPDFVDDIYTKKVEVETLPDNLTKKITATVSWMGRNNRPLNVSLTSLVTNFEFALGGNTCSSVLSGNWTNPQIKNANTSLADLSGNAAGSYPITGIDVYKNRLYVTASNPGVNQETLFVFNVSNPSNPVLISKVDNDPLVNTGLAGIRVDGKYAYTVSATATKQLQIFDITVDPPSLVSTMNATGNGLGNAIFYKGGYAYIGLTTGSGPAFAIADVHAPSTPSVVGTFNLGNTVNSIWVSGSYAYLGTPASSELRIVNITNNTAPVAAGSFDAPGGSGNGKSLYLVGEMLYFGRTLGGDELFVLNAANPAAVLPALGSFDLGTESVNGLIVRDTLAFMLTNHQLHIANISNPAAIVSYAPTLTLPGAITSGGSSLDCEGNYLYAGTRTNGGLYVIAP